MTSANLVILSEEIGEVDKPASWLGGIIVELFSADLVAYSPGIARRDLVFLKKLHSGASSPSGLRLHTLVLMMWRR